MDAAVIIWCVVAPAVIMVAGVAAAYWVAGSPEPQTGSPAGLASLVVVTGWIASVTVPLIGRQGLAGWPEDAWQQTLVPAAFGALGISYLCHLNTGLLSQFRWVWVALFAVATGMFAMESGEGWEDTYELHHVWIPCVTVSVLVNAWSLISIANARATRWVSWVALAGIAGPTMMAAAAYGGLAEWLAAACIATGIGAVLAIFVTRFPLWTVSLPSLFLASAGTASARLFAWESYPWWVYGIALFLPTIIYLGDAFLRNSPSWQRIVAAAVMATALLVLMAWGLFRSGPSDEYSRGVNEVQISVSDSLSEGFGHVWTF